METFYSKTYGRCTFEEAIEHIEKYIESEPDREFTLAIGTDSQNTGNKTKFVNVIMVHKVGSGGIYFYTKSYQPKVQVIYNRMMEEARQSIELTSKFLDVIEDHYINEKFDWDRYSISMEVHADFGPNGKSSAALADAIGWIKSAVPSDFYVYSKPDSPAASHIADKFTK